MYKDCEKEINEIWEKLNEGDTFRTPDDLKGVYYTINQKGTDKIQILPQKVTIQRKAFVEALYFLVLNNHYEKNKCEIRSNNDKEMAGPLCLASRNANNNVRCINYIIPILKKYGLVEFSGKRPNKVWIIEK